jgi:hypothetical protein
MSIQFNRGAKVATIPIADGTTITIQDVYNQFRDFEDEPQNLDLNKMIDGVGKDDLGGGLFTVITVTLRDGWLLAFEARGGPGTELMVVSEGNLVATDEAGDAQFPISPTAFTTTVIAQATTGAILTGGGASAQEVWDYVPTANVDGSAGQFLFKKLAQFAQLIGLVRG